MKHIFILLLIAFIAGCSSKKEEKLELVDKVVVYKSRRELQLIKAGKAIRSYKIALGDNPLGHKSEEGDERTPEGKYILDWRNSKSAFHKSIHISYPNEQDIAKANKVNVSPGGDIMIHGIHKKMAWIGSWHTMRDWTNGCIALTNEEMDEIWVMVKNGTPIEIYK